MSEVQQLSDDIQMCSGVRPTFVQALLDVESRNRTDEVQEVRESIRSY